MKFKSSLIIFLLIIASFDHLVFAALPEVKTYNQLLSAIRETRQVNDPQNQKAKVREAWTIGKLIELHALEHALWADYHAYVIKRLSEDLEMKLDDLRRMRRFVRVYSEGVPPQDLDWWHYQAIMDIPDFVQREAIAARDEKERWTSDQLQAEIKKLREGNITQTEDSQSSESAPGELHTYSATVTQVLDGDTFDAVVDLGFGMTAGQRFRLSGLDAPELDAEKGIEAKAFLVNQMEEAKGHVIIKSVEQDKYGRYLAEVWIDGKSLNQKLLKSGMAIVVRD